MPEITRLLNDQLIPKMHYDSVGPWEDPQVYQLLRSEPDAQQGNAVIKLNAAACRRWRERVVNSVLLDPEWLSVVTAYRIDAMYSTAHVVLLSELPPPAIVSDALIQLVKNHPLLSECSPVASVLPAEPAGAASSPPSSS